MNGDVVYNGVSLVVLVVGVVQVIKQTGKVRGDWIKALAVGLAFLIFAGRLAAETWPVIKPFFDVLMAGLYGVAATGLYDTAKQLSGGTNGHG